VSQDAFDNLVAATDIELGSEVCRARAAMAGWVWCVSHVIEQGSASGPVSAFRCASALTHLSIPASLFSQWGGALPGSPTGGPFLFCEPANYASVSCNFTGPAC
jgi:hypothetical protein